MDPRPSQHAVTSHELRFPPPSLLSAHWGLDPGMVHLNHGSFGACPRSVLSAQAAHRDRMEAEAISFFAADLSGLLDVSREAIAPLLGVASESVVFVPNATTGVATALQFAAEVGFEHGPLASGDEILIPEHEYPACRHNAERVAQRVGARIVGVPLGVPTSPSGQRVTAASLVERILAGVTPRTRVCLLSLVTSPSALRLPVEILIPELRTRGVETILDAAHGVGCVPIDLATWQPAFMTTNAHKWLCAPKGAAVLWARDDLRARVRPVVLSNLAHAPEGFRGRSRWQTEFDYTGTCDVTPWLAIADAMRTIPALAGTDWQGVMQQNRMLALQGRRLVCDALGVPVPADEDLIGPMAMIPLPKVEDAPHAERLWARPSRFADALWDELNSRYRIQIPVWRPVDPMTGQQRTGERFVRLSAQIYNTPEQYRYLAESLQDALEREQSA